MQDDGIAGPQVLHSRSDFAYPACVLVAKGVGERDTTAIRPLTLDDVQIRTAQARTTHVDEHIPRPPERRVGNLLDPWTLVIGVQPNCLHSQRE